MIKKIVKGMGLIACALMLSFSFNSCSESDSDNMAAGIVLMQNSSSGKTNNPANPDNPDNPIGDDEPVNAELPAYSVVVTSAKLQSEDLRGSIYPVGNVDSYVKTTVDDKNVLNVEVLSGKTSDIWETYLYFDKIEYVAGKNYEISVDLKADKKTTGIVQFSPYNSYDGSGEYIELTDEWQTFSIYSDLWDETQDAYFQLAFGLADKVSIRNYSIKESEKEGRIPTAYWSTKSVIYSNPIISTKDSVEINHVAEDNSVYYKLFIGSTNIGKLYKIELNATAEKETECRIYVRSYEPAKGVSGGTFILDNDAGKDITLYMACHSGAEAKEVTRQVCLEVNPSEKAKITISDIKITEVDSMPDDRTVYLGGGSYNGTEIDSYTFAKFKDGILNYCMHPGKTLFQILLSDDSKNPWNNFTSFRLISKNDVAGFNIIGYVEYDSLDGILAENTTNQDIWVKISFDEFYGLCFEQGEVQDIECIEPAFKWYIKGDFTAQTGNFGEVMKYSTDGYYYDFVYNSETMHSWGSPKQMVQFRLIAQNGGWYGSDDAVENKFAKSDWSNSNNIRAQGLIDGNTYVVKLRFVDLDTADYTGPYVMISGDFDPNYEPVKESSVPYIVGDITDSKFVLMTAEDDGLYSYTVTLPDDFEPTWGDTGIAFKFSTWGDWGHPSIGAGDFGEYSSFNFYSSLHNSSDSSNCHWPFPQPGDTVKITLNLTDMKCEAVIVTE